MDDLPAIPSDSDDGEINSDMELDAALVESDNNIS